MQNADTTAGRSEHSESTSGNAWLAVVAMIVSLLLPDHRSSEVTPTHLVSALFVTVVSCRILRSHVRLRQGTFAWHAIHWYAVVSFALIVFIMAIRIRYPIVSFADAYNNRLQRVAEELMLMPVLGLLAFALLLVLCVPVARSSLLVWFCLWLTITVFWKP